MFNIKNFAELKPYVWNSLKTDYNLKSDNKDDNGDFYVTPKPIHTRSTTSTVEPGPSRTAHSQRTAETLDQILAKLKG